MEDPQTKAEVLDQLQTVRGEWEAVLAAIGEERMTEPGAEGTWSVKDVIAHIERYERWLGDRIRHVSAEPTPADTMEIEERNVWMHEQDRDRTLADVQAGEAEAYATFRDAVSQLSEAELLDPQQIGQFLDPAWTRGEPLARWVASEVTNHCAAHTAVLRAWLDGHPA